MRNHRVSADTSAFEQVGSELTAAMERNAVTRALGAAVAGAWLRLALGRKAHAVDEPFNYAAFKAGLDARRVAPVGWLLMKSAHEAFARQEDVDEVPPILEDPESLRRALEKAGLFPGAPGEGAPDDQNPPANDVPAQPDDDVGTEGDDGGQEPENDAEPEERPEAPDGEDEEASPDDYHYKILIDRLDCFEDTPGWGDDEPQWHVRGASYWRGGVRLPIRFESAEKQDVVTGDVLSAIPPDRRVPQDVEHLIRYSDGFLARRGGEEWFQLRGFRYVDFRIELYEIDDTDAFVEAFRLLGDLFDTLTGIGALFNPLLAIGQLLSSVPDPNSREAREAADTIQKIMEKLKENDLLGEYVGTITEPELRSATYEKRDDLEVAVEQKGSGQRFCARDRDGDLLYHYVMSFRYERKILPAD